MQVQPISATYGAASLEMKAESAPFVSGLAAPEAWLADWGGIAAAAGPAVTPASAMSVPTVASAVGLISGAIGSLPVKIYRNDGAQGGRVEAPDHPAHDLVHDQSNDWTSASQLRAQLVTDALLRGNGYGLVRRDADGIPIEILRLQPESVSNMLDPRTSEPWFKFGTGPGQEIIAHADMIHVPAPCSLDGITGVAPITRARDAISLAIALERHAARIFAKGARPSGVLSFPGNMTGQGVTNARASFEAQHTGENSGKPAVVYGGATWTPTEFSTVDLQFMAMRAFQIGEVAKAFNVPPTLVGELAKATLSNSETMGRQFLQMTLLPWINTIRAAYRRALISREDRKTYSVDFVLDGLLQADSAQRAAFYAAMRTSAIMTANEIRRLENLPDLPDGNTLASPHTTTTAAPALEAPLPDTAINAFLGDRNHSFDLIPHLLELEEIVGAGTGAIVKRVIAGDFKAVDISTIVRLALIGGGMLPKDAASLVANYVTARPLAEGHELATQIVMAAWAGTRKSPVKQAPSEIILVHADGREEVLAPVGDAS